jgi:hypothetical protein
VRPNNSSTTTTTTAAAAAAAAAAATSLSPRCFYCEGLLVTAGWETSKHYLFSWFFLDLLCNVTTVMQWAQPSGGDLGMALLFKNMRLVKAVKLVNETRGMASGLNLGECFTGGDGKFFTNWKRVTALTQRLCLLMLCGHMVGCGYHWWVPSRQEIVAFVEQHGVEPMNWMQGYLGDGAIESTSLLSK